MEIGMPLRWITVVPLKHPVQAPEPAQPAKVPVKAPSKPTTPAKVPEPA
jgi:hypothetical protein